jgi:hypothetical protein
VKATFELLESWDIWESAKTDPVAAADHLRYMALADGNFIEIHCLLTMRLIREVEKLRAELSEAQQSGLTQ